MTLDLPATTPVARDAKAQQALDLDALERMAREVAPRFAGCSFPHCACDTSNQERYDYCWDAGAKNIAKAEIEPDLLLALIALARAAEARLEKARTWKDGTGVGCPLCKHEGDQWVEPCALHAQIGNLQEDLQVQRRVFEHVDDTFEAVCEVIGVDSEDDPVAAAQDRVYEIEADKRDAWIAGRDAAAEVAKAGPPVSDWKTRSTSNWITERIRTLTPPERIDG